MITGWIYQPTVTSLGDNTIKHLPIEVRDIAFLSADTVSNQFTPVKG
jgi:hypothetical protein